MEKILFGKNFDNNYQKRRENCCTTLGKRRFGKNGKNEATFARQRQACALQTLDFELCI